MIVKFNPTAYANSNNVLQWSEEQLIRVLKGQPTFLAIDLFSDHGTEEVVDNCRADDITSRIIPGGCAGVVQPLDVSINRPFKNLLSISTSVCYGGLCRPKKRGPLVQFHAPPR